MRRLELTTPLSVDAETAWSVLINTADWSDWGRLVVSAEGVFEAGHVWTMQLVGTDGHTKSTMNPQFVSMVPGAQVVFETRIGGGLVSMVHTFDVEPDGAGRSVLRQTFVITGVLVVPLWRWLLPGMMQFEQLGVDLAQRLRRPPAPGVPDEPVR